MNIPLLDLKAQYYPIKDEIKSAIEEVLESQHFILGPKVKQLEEEIALYSQCKYALGVSSGTDAILLALMALDVKTEDIVITTPYTFFATAGCIARLGARPMFVDIDVATYNIDANEVQRLLDSLDVGTLSKVKAVIPVHLFGQMADMEKLANICERYELPIIEDAAQAIGSECLYNSEVRKAGSIGDIGCFSFFPSKNLGGYGDGGMVVTNNEDLYKKMRILRAHGSEPKYFHKYIGGNFRLDEIQAAVLLVKLKYLNDWSKQRQHNAEIYNSKLSTLSPNHLKLPKALYESYNVSNYHIYNQYCIQVEKRDELKQFLKENGIATEIYYPVPMHLQECFSNLGFYEGQYIQSELAAKRSLALPVYPELSEDAIKNIVEGIMTFYCNRR